MTLISPGKWQNTAAWRIVAQSSVEELAHACAYISRAALNDVDPLMIRLTIVGICQTHPLSRRDGLDCLEVNRVDLYPSIPA